MSATNHAPDGNVRSIFARLAVPFMFNPDLGPGAAFFAVIGALMRIFGACVLFALWGGFSAWVWTLIGNRFWRMAALGPLVLLFPAILALLFLGIGALEAKRRPRH